MTPYDYADHAFSELYACIVRHKYARLHVFLPLLADLLTSHLDAYPQSPTPLHSEGRHCSHRWAHVLHMVHR